MKLPHLTELPVFFLYEKIGQKRRAFRRRREEVGSNRWGYKSCRQQRAALVLLAAYGKRNLPLPPGLTIVGDESSGYGIEQNNELRQQEKTCSQRLANAARGPIPARELYALLC